MKYFLLIFIPGLIFCLLSYFFQVAFDVEYEIGMLISLVLIAIAIVLYFVNKKAKSTPSQTDKLLKYKAEIEKNKPVLDKLDDKLQIQKKIAIGKSIFGEKFVLYKVEEELQALEAATKQRQANEKNRQAFEKSEAERRKKQERLQRIKKAENERFNELNKYSQHYGLDKRIAIITDERDIIKKLLRNAKFQKSQAEVALSEAKKVQKQQGRQGDWALRSGAATALFGPVVGAGVALQTIHDNNSNLEIKGMLMNGKIKNTQNKQEALNAIIREIANLEKQISDYDREIEETKQKLVANTSKSDVFNSLKITYKKTSVSETGAITVTAFAELKEDISVFGEIPTIIDGSLNAKLYQNSHLVGEAYMVLPKGGIGEKVKLEGICLNRLNNGIPYEVKIEPNQLWYMEK